MKLGEGKFEGAGGLSLYARWWLPEGDPRGSLWILHGIGEYCDRYDYLVDGLVDHGLGVYGFDLRGHRRSPGQRDHIYSWDEYRLDTARYRSLPRIDPGKTTR